jgi:hypothetical protein
MRSLLLVVILMFPVPLLCQESAEYPTQIEIDTLMRKRRLR